MTQGTIFHIAERPRVSSLREDRPYLPPGFEDEGFLHCSTRAQLVATANRIFHGREDLCVLEIDMGRVPAEIRFENLEGGEEPYPHVYGPLPWDAVKQVHEWSFAANGDFRAPETLLELAFEVADELRRTVEASAALLHDMPSVRSGIRPVPGKWSPKEILGHLVDSASNNHGRFVRARNEDGLHFAGYDQNEWVTAGAYERVPWPELVELWRLLNLQIARVVETTSSEDLQRERQDHNLDRIAWRLLPANEPATLEYFVRDYVGHLRHHLGQIDPQFQPGSDAGHT